MFGANPFGVPMFGQGASSNIPLYLLIGKAWTKAIAGFARYTRRVTS